MKRKDTGRGMLLLWTASVYALSFLCYLPMLAQRMGMALPGGAVNLKYLFVCVPAVVSVLFSLRERRLRAYFAGMFSGRPGGREFSAGLAIAAAGLLVSWGYEARTGVPVFENAYPSVAALLAGCLYLLATGLVEEMAWRGFLLERLPQKGIKGAALAGLVWAAWHIPMWTIRNGLGLRDIPFLCVWTVLVAIVLGTAYYRSGSILTAAVLHMLFNTCCLAPVQYNIPVLAVIILGGAWVGKKNRRIL